MYIMLWKLLNSHKQVTHIEGTVFLRENNKALGLGDFLKKCLAKYLCVTVCLRQYQIMPTVSTNLLFVLDFPFSSDFLKVVL